MQSIENKVINRIYGKGRGWAFSKIDFIDIGQDLFKINTLDHVYRRQQGLCLYLVS